MTDGVAGQGAALYGPRPPARRRIGASPSGKAADFDSAIRRFESSRPSHAFLGIVDFAGRAAQARIPRGFAGAETADRSVVELCDAILPPVCNAQFRVSGILRRARPRRVRDSGRPVRTAVSCAAGVSSDAEGGFLLCPG